MKKLLYVFALVTIIFSGTACNSQTLNLANDRQSLIKTDFGKGKDAMEAIINAYRSKASGSLDALISDDYYSGKQEFINRIEQSSIDKTILDVFTSVNQAILKDGLLVVNFKWNRSYIPKGSATQTNDRGTTTFVFANENGNWLLINYSGSDIFN